MGFISPGGCSLSDPGVKVLGEGSEIKLIHISPSHGDLLQVQERSHTSRFLSAAGQHKLTLYQQEKRLCSPCFGG